MRILLLAAQENSAIFAIRLLGSLKVNIYVLATKECAVLRYSRHCKKFYLCGQDDFSKPHKNFVKKIKSIIDIDQIDLIFPVNMVTVYFASRLKRIVSNCNFFHWIANLLSINWMINGHFISF